MRSEHETLTPTNPKSKLIEAIYQEDTPQEADPVLEVRQPEIVKAVKPRAIDVPDDGNCLFYAIAIGLKKKHGRLADWRVNPEDLAGDLSKKAGLLKAPADQLRREAADYLTEHRDISEITAVLIEGAFSHINAVQKKIEDEEAVLPLLQLDIQELEGRPQSNLTQKQLTEKREAIAIKEASIQERREEIEKIMNDYGAYIIASKKDFFYCGTAQIFSLSKKYDIPIQVIFKYGTEAQRLPETFGPQNGKKPITIAHVNENHFQYIDD